MVAFRMITNDMNMNMNDTPGTTGPPRHNVKDVETKDVETKDVKTKDVDIHVIRRSNMNMAHG